MDLQLFNSDGQQLQQFKPLQPGKVLLYCCGPTVYAVAHLGNMRAYLSQDLLRRTLEMLGYQVQQVMNITDVGHLSDDGDDGEDKMLTSARQRGWNVWQIAEHFTEIFYRDCQLLRIKRPQVNCRATDHIAHMIAMITKLEELGYAYRSDGNVYFDVGRLGPDYGRIVQLKRQQLRPGQRIAIDQGKRNPQDFVLWFTNSKFEHQAMQWDSPWGCGYPGWHIECSAMAMHYLGERIDIHCGGVDHLAVHHSNEIAQSEAVLGHRWVNYWFHNEFLLMSDDKMSKSSGNILDLEAIIKKNFHPLDYRYFIFTGHYRSQIKFSFTALQAAQNARTRLQQRLNQLSQLEPGATESDRLEDYWQQFQQALCRDLNSPQALAVLWEALKDDQLTPGQLIQFGSRCDQVLDLELLPTRDHDLPAPLQQLWQRRLEARRQRNFALADELRQQLQQHGIMVQDGPQGSTWQKITR